MTDVDDDECTPDPTTGACSRTDDAHLYEVLVLRTWTGDPVHRRGRCLHRHVVEVETGGEVVAQLCPTCDQQLPATWTA